MQDIIKPRGTTKNSRPEAGGANTRTAPVFGIVKDNIDPNRSGRIRVYIADFSGLDPNDESNWISVKYMPTFFGRVSGGAPSDANDYGKYALNPASYGEWHAPPDLETRVICIFVNGDMNYGYYIGADPDPQELQMVPAIGADTTIVPEESEIGMYAGAAVLPVTNMNTYNEAAKNSSDFIQTPKPIHSDIAKTMAEQGIIRDQIRGPISSSALREPTSRVGWGVSSPGRPIYQGGYDDESIANQLNSNQDQNLKVVSRKGGHSIVLDDGDAFGNDNLIRIRSAAGHQILMSDNGETFVMIHANGKSYIEFGREGTIDMFSTNSVNIRTEGDLNLHADNNVNIHAKKNMNMYAENMNITTVKDHTSRIGRDNVSEVVGIKTTKVRKAFSMQSGGTASLASSNKTYINGSSIFLNTGRTSVVPKSVEPLSETAHIDTEYTSSKGYVAAPGKLKSITTRAPAHFPWAMAGQGVNLPNIQEPTSFASLNVLNAVNAGTSLGIAPVSRATIASMPEVKQLGNGIDLVETNALLATMAKTAAQSPFATAQQQGIGITTDVNNNSIITFGQFTQSPRSLEAAGILKPGSNAIIQSLAQSKTPNQCVPDVLFTGKDGINTIEQYIRDLEKQVSTGTDSLQSAKAQLVNTGAISGNEPTTDLSGMILSSVVNGYKSVVNTVKSIPGVIQNDVATEPLKFIGLGVAAIGVAKLMSSERSLSQLIGAELTTNITDAAPTYIANGFTDLIANKPQSIRQSDAIPNPVIEQKKNKISKKPTVTQLDINNVATGLTNLPGKEKSVAHVINESDINTTAPSALVSLSSRIAQARDAKLSSESVPKINGKITDFVSSNSTDADKAQIFAVIDSINTQSGDKLPTTRIS